MRLDRRLLVRALAGGLGAALGGLLFAKRSEFTKDNQVLDDEGSYERAISLSPGVTDTIFALGRGDLLVAVSDYCQLPRGRTLPRVGTAITPNFERIAISRPDLIIASQVAGEAMAPLRDLAPTLSLPWLTLEEWLASINTLGETLACQEEAGDLITRLQSRLKPKTTPDAPRVLLALDYGASGTNETWFIRRNSIHGAVLEAAGANNAVTRDVTGQPKLSPEALLALDPDAIIVLRSGKAAPKLDAQARAHFGKWTPLSAAQNDRIATIAFSGALTVGPLVLDLLPLLENTLAQLFSEHDFGHKATSVEK